MKVGKIGSYFLKFMCNSYPTYLVIKLRNEPQSQVKLYFKFSTKVNNKEGLHVYVEVGTYLMY